MLECLQDWSFSVSNGLPTDVIYLDFAKAFDSVSHEKLIYKLQAYGICGDLLEWIKNFLFDRKQRVIIENSPSNYIHVASGVPQGTILGPLLFLIFINDMADEIFWSKIKLYADDSKVYSEINNANDVNNLQADINRLSDWTNSWQLNLSIQKCSVLHLKPKETPDVYLIDNIPLPSSDFMKDLGVIMSQDLKFHDHCSAVSNKAHSVCGLILRCFVTKSPDFMVKMFITFARSILEYCSPAWSPYHICDIDKIENVQRRFTKRISGLYETPYLDRLAFLKLESLETRRIKSDILQTFKIVNGLELNFDDFFVKKSHNYPTRLISTNPIQLQPKHTGNSQLLNSFSYRVVNLWNNLPFDTSVSNSIEIFKNKLENIDFTKQTQGRAFKNLVF